MSSTARSWVRESLRPYRRRASRLGHRQALVEFSFTQRRRIHPGGRGPDLPSPASCWLSRESYSRYGLAPTPSPRRSAILKQQTSSSVAGLASALVLDLRYVTYFVL